MLVYILNSELSGFYQFYVGYGLFIYWVMVFRVKFLIKLRYLFLRNMSASTLRNKIGVLLLDQPMSLKEVAQELEIKEKKAYSLLKNMFQNDRVIGFKDLDGQRKYRNTELETEAALKRKAKADKKAAKAK